jgi:hypothetical protein
MRRRRGREIWIADRAYQRLSSGSEFTIDHLDPHLSQPSTHRRYGSLQSFAMGIDVSLNKPAKIENI